jgi:plasmid stability protein
MIQIRNVPEEIHRRLKVRAAIEGMSMSDYVLREIRKALNRPTRQEILERLQAKPLRRLRRNAAVLIRAARDAQ